MPDNRIEQDGLYGRINSLEEEIADLKYTNQKLYKDCVTFAKKLKKIQVSGILDEDVNGLKELNTQYAEEIAALKELYNKLKEKGVTVERLWDCYAIKQPEKVKRGTVAQLTDLISMIRFEMKKAETLTPFYSQVSANFQKWTLRKNAGNIHFTDEQMEWLRLIKDHIAASLSIEPDDLELSPFDRKGGLGRFYEVFGDDYEAILHELNIELVA